MIDAKKELLDHIIKTTYIDPTGEEPVIETGMFNRDRWGDGDWMDEPLDAIFWTDAATNLPCALVRSAYGNWCGYVGLPIERSTKIPDYSEVRWPDDWNFRVDYAQEDRPFYTISAAHPHSGVWWYGFSMDDYAPEGAIALLAALEQLPEDNQNRSVKDFAESHFDPVKYKTLDDASEAVVRLAMYVRRNFHERIYT